MKYTFLWFICNMSCIITFVFHVMIAPFFPEVALSKGINHTTVGYIFSAYPISNLLSSLLLIRVFDKISKKNIIIFSQSITVSLGSNSKPFSFSHKPFS